MHRSGGASYSFVSVPPGRPRQFEVTDLQMDTQYSFSIMAFNKQGESGYSAELVQTRTASKLHTALYSHHHQQSLLNTGNNALVLWPEFDQSEPMRPTPVAPGAPDRAGAGPARLLSVITVTGGLLFVANLGLLYCYVKRRARKHMFGEFPPLTSPCLQAPRRPAPAWPSSITCWRKSRRFL